MSPRTGATGRLTGVGVGPGDPDLITVKAVRVLTSADVVFVPVANEGEARAVGDAYVGYAERVVRAHAAQACIERLVFALGDDARARDRNWDEAGRAVAAVVRDGGHAAFATIGDPNLYSTFTYLWDTVAGLVPDVAVDTVPGITALQDLAARSGTVLAEGTERLALLPFTAGPERLAAALADYDTVISYKGGRHLPRVRDLLDEAGRRGEAVLGARLGLPDEVIGPLPDEGTAPYLSTVIVRRPRGERGEKL